MPNRSRRLIAILAGAFTAVTLQCAAVAAEPPAGSSDIPTAYYVYAEPDNVPNRIRSDTKAWTDDERQDVEKTLREVKKRNPRVLKAALKISNLYFFRLIPSDRAYAETFPDGIGLTDAFFKENKYGRYHTLLHELCHWLDAGGRVSFSAKWIEFAEPQIARTRCSEVLFDKRKRQLPKYKAPFGGWVTPTNLSEALASFYAYAAISDGMKRKLDPMERYVVDRVESPTEAECTELRSHDLLFAALQERKYELAVDISANMAKANLNAPTNHLWQLFTRRLLPNGTVSEAEAEKVKCQLDAMRIPQHEFEQRVCRRMLTDVRSREEHLRDLLESPGLTTLSGIAYHYSLALSPTRVAQIMFVNDAATEAKLKLLRESDCDPPFVQRKLDVLVTSTERSVNALRLRAGWCQEQQQHARALHDYVVCLKSPHRKPHDFGNAILCLTKMGRLEEAKNLSQKLETIFPDAGELVASRVALLEAEGNIEAARQELQKSFGQMEPHNVKDVGDYVPPEGDMG